MFATAKKSNDALNASMSVVKKAKKDPALLKGPKFYEATPEFAKIIGAGKISRQDALKNFWEYVKKNSLQVPLKLNISCPSNVIFVCRIQRRNQKLRQMRCLRVSPDKIALKLQRYIFVLYLKIYLLLNRPYLMD